MKMVFRRSFCGGCGCFLFFYVRVRRGDSRIARLRQKNDPTHRGQAGTVDDLTQMGRHTSFGGGTSTPTNPQGVGVEILAVIHAEGMGEDGFRRPDCGKCGLFFCFSTFVFVGGDVHGAPHCGGMRFRFSPNPTRVPNVGCIPRIGGRRERLMISRKWDAIPPLAAGRRPLQTRREFGWMFLP